MIFGVGIDIVSVNRIEELMLRFKEKFAEKIFTENEIAQANQLQNSAVRISFYAKRFAAKEAFSKALGLGLGRGINFTDIEIYNEENGKPKIKILHEKMDFINQHFSCEKIAIHLSLTDEKPIASAFVIIEKIV